jgi:hypothetical protein
LSVIAYAYPYPANEGSKLRYYVFPYIYPYFHQSWTLFVPVPKENFNVYVKQDGQEWEDLFYNVYSAHQNNRLGGNEALMLALSNSLRYYASSVKGISGIEKDDDTNVNFTVLRKIVKNYYTLKFEKAPENLKIIIRIKDINKETDHSHYYKISS